MSNKHAWNNTKKVDSQRKHGNMTTEDSLNAEMHGVFLNKRCGSYTTPTVLQTKRVHFAFWHKLVYNFKITSSLFKKVDRNIP